MVYISGKYSRGSSPAPQPSDFSPAMDKQTTILRNGALLSAYPSPAKNHKTTIIPLEVSDDFFGANVGKATLFQRLLSPHPHPSKILVTVAGMIGQVSQNGMPFCTGMHPVRAHPKLARGASPPWNPHLALRKMKLRNIHWKFLRSIFGFARESTRRIVFCTGRCIWEAICKLCGLRRRQITTKNV